MIISDSSPLIAVTQIGLEWLLPALFDDVLVPGAVARETARSVPSFPWLRERQASIPLDERVTAIGLGAGESEVLSLALELGGMMVLLDERDARRLAARLGIPHAGTLGVLLEARRRNLIPALRPAFEDLIRNRFFLSEELMSQLLADMGES